MNGNVPDLSKLNQRVVSGVSAVGFIRELNEDGLFEPASHETMADGSIRGILSRRQIMDAEDLIAAIRQEVHEELQAVLQEFKRAIVELSKKK